MSHPVLSSAARRLTRHHSHSPAASVQRCHRLFSTSRTAAPSISASLSGQPAANRLGESRKAQSLRNRLSQSSVSPFAVSRQRYAFSSSAARPSAKILQNPRTDDDGNELMVSISSRAAERLRTITDPTTSPNPTKDENPYHHLRITVTSGGCHGFQYMMSLESASKIDAEEDTVFESEDGKDAGAGEAKVVMDQPSLELLTGSTIDFTTELIGSQFTIVDNPRATSNCGCGTSFDVNV